MISKELVRGALQGKTVGRIAFAPLVWSFAAKLHQVAVKEMAADPSIMASALSDAQKLLGYDAIVTTFDPTLEAEGLGCEIEWCGDNQYPRLASHPFLGHSGPYVLTPEFLKKGRIPAVLESARRLNIVRGKEVAIIGTVTGPAALASGLTGRPFWPDFEADGPNTRGVIDHAAAASQALVKAYCEVGVDAVMVVDDMPETAGGKSEQMKALYRPLWNVLRYYRVSSILMVRGCKSENRSILVGLGPDTIVTYDVLETPLSQVGAPKAAPQFGEAISHEDLVVQNTDEIRRRIVAIMDRCNRNNSLFLTTQGEVPCEASTEAMQGVAKMVRSGGG